MLSGTIDGDDDGGKQKEKRDKGGAAGSLEPAFAGKSSGGEGARRTIG